MNDMMSQLEQTLAESNRVHGPTRAGMTGHDVHFYRSEASLVRSVVNFLADGVRAGQPLVVIATPEHQRLFSDGLRARGLDIDELYSGRLAVWLDARDTLACFMEGGCPNRELFMATIGSVFERMINKRSYLIVRGYGEMVDLLWKDGNREGAILLEQLWNDLADRYAYSLLCGYCVENFFMAGGVDGFRRVCGQHTHALPMDDGNEDVA
jgi:MEDS: MEthanogen/methylotroph, DcmR Sensory domain